MPISNRTKVKKTGKFIERKVFDEILLVPLTIDVAQPNEYFALKGTGLFIWQRLDTHDNASDILSEMIKKYAADEKSALEDIVKFLTELEKAGIVELIE